MGGLTANLHYQVGEIGGSNGKKNVGVNALYFNGPLTVTGFYERDQVGNPAVPSVDLGTTKTDWMLGGAYDFTVVKAFASYGQAKADNAPGRSKTVQLGASVPACGQGPGIVGADEGDGHQRRAQDLHGGI